MALDSCSGLTIILRILALCMIEESGCHAFCIRSDSRVYGICLASNIVYFVKPYENSQSLGRGHAVIVRNEMDPSRQPLEQVLVQS